MPYKFEKMRIPKQHDRRVKLTQEQKDEIRYRYLNVGGVSQRELAREYGVSRRLIVFCIYPERMKDNYNARLARGGSRHYYDKGKNTEYMRNHRHYKRDLYREGKLLGERNESNT